MLFCHECGQETPTLRPENKEEIEVVKAAFTLIEMAQDMPPQVATAIPGFEVLIRNCEHVLADLGWLEAETA